MLTWFDSVNSKKYFSKRSIKFMQLVFKSMSKRYMQIYYHFFSKKKIYTFLSENFQEGLKNGSKTGSVSYAQQYVLSFKVRCCDTIWENISHTHDIFLACIENFLESVEVLMNPKTLSKTCRIRLDILISDGKKKF